MLHRYLNKKGFVARMWGETISIHHSFILWEEDILEEEGNKGGSKHSFLGLAIFSVSKRIHLQFFLSFHLYFQFRKITFIVIPLPFRKI